MSFGTWYKTTDALPMLLPGEYGWPQSKRVLLLRSRELNHPFVGYLDCVDEDEEPNWRSGCSEGWSFNLSEITYWCELPAPPPPAASEPLRPCGNAECGVSTGIHDTAWRTRDDPPGLTFGRGELDAYGYWDIPCPVCARFWEQKDNVPVGSYWPWPKEEEKADAV